MTMTDEITVGGWTATGRFFGKCRDCKKVTRVDTTPTTTQTMNIVCECGSKVVAKQVFGYKTETACDARCMNATGPDCECSCGGRQHGANR